MSFRLEDHFFTKERLDQKVNYLGAEDPRPGFRVPVREIYRLPFEFFEIGLIERKIKNLHLRVGCDEKVISRESYGFRFLRNFSRIFKDTSEVPLKSEFNSDIKIN